MIKLEKEYTSFILIHFKDTNSVASVMQNKDYIIVADCKVNVSEPRVCQEPESRDIDRFYFILRIKITNDQKVMPENRYRWKSEIDGTNQILLFVSLFTF